MVNYVDTHARIFRLITEQPVQRNNRSKTNKMIKLNRSKRPYEFKSSAS